jgi:hypothetical protein
MMDVFDKIKNEIMKDSSNDSYTKLGIEPLYKASKKASTLLNQKL